MKTTLFILGFVLISNVCIAQESKDLEGITKACMNYLEGFYEGDTSKLEQALSPNLYKFGYWKNKETQTYAAAGQMTYEKALDYAKNVADKKEFAKEDAVKVVEVLDISNHIAAAKVKAWWGIDYMLLSKEDGAWIIKQVLWEGPLEKSHLD
ncbi:MAG: nuclear transport factor 2 family protein [Bacteroidota bacterium]